MKRALLLVAVAAVAACGRPDVIAEDENAAALPEPVNRSAPSPTGGPPANNVAAGAPATASKEIPVAIRGRWGLTPRDCITALGDAKGLLIVNSEELRFYESRAFPAPDAMTTQNSISGDFSFTGEGQTWSSHLTLELRDEKLVRTQRDPVARFNYVRC